MEKDHAAMVEVEGAFCDAVRVGIGRRGDKERWMDWRFAVGWGAAGGLAVEIVLLSRDILGWQAERRAASEAGRSTATVMFTPDLLGHLGAAVVRVLLGAIAGVIGHSQISGAAVAVGIGAGAPELLFRQLVDNGSSARFDLTELTNSPQQGIQGLSTSVNPQSSAPVVEQTAGEEAGH